MYKRQPVTNAQSVTRTVTESNIDAIRVTVRFDALISINEKDGKNIGTQVDIFVRITENDGTTTLFNRSTDSQFRVRGKKKTNNIRDIRITIIEKKYFKNDCFIFGSESKGIPKNILEKLEADIAIVVAYGQILPKGILHVCKKGFINIHASLLPKLRGAAPIQRSIMNLDNETGISIMQINEKLDQGKVYSQYKIKINKDDNAEDLSFRLSNLAAEKIVDDIESIFANKKNFFEQDHSKATYANKINKEEGRIDWNDKAENIIGKINGLYPVPGAWFYFDGARYKILKASVSKNSATPGKVINDNIEVSCGTNSIKILEIQREGKKVQNIKDFILGTKIKKGINLINA